MSPPVGGCTFAENPAHGFGRARIVWTAAFDPAVIEVDAEPLAGRTDGFDIAGFGSRIAAIVDDTGEHVAVAAPGRHLRLDVATGTLFAGPVHLRYRLNGVATLPPSLDALHALLRLVGVPDPARRTAEPDRRLPRLVEALRVLDALSDGASRHAIAEALLGSGDWPGDGEHRKSLVRRRIDLARHLQDAGPKAVLRGLI